MLERIHLSILREVNRHGSLTAAANILCLTQSALSHTIKKLEEQLGIPLWIRKGRRLHLTQAGHCLLNLSHRLLPQFEHTEELIRQYAQGLRGTLRIGMECHPCYQWLLKIVSPYLTQWPQVNVDVKQKFQFGGVGALYGHEIDILITPDPFQKTGLCFKPVFDYEQVLVVGTKHKLAKAPYVSPKQLINETLITYPVEIERLDIYNQFLLPAGYHPEQRKIIETTDIMLQMVAAGRGVAALPRWLVMEYSKKMAITSVRLGKKGVAKQIFLGWRETDHDLDYLQAFVELATMVAKIAL
jgi:LysR family transcriptional regulator for metE and metH